MTGLCISVFPSCVDHSWSAVLKEKKKNPSGKKTNIRKQKWATVMND